MKRKPIYWAGQTERLFTRMLPEVRAPLLTHANTQKVLPKEIIEEAIVELISSGDFDTSFRCKTNEAYQGCTYRIDTGIAEQLRRISRATGESMQTMLHEAITRKLNIQPLEGKDDNASSAS